jgi:hypothetical protein
MELRGSIVAVCKPAAFIRSVEKGGKAAVSIEEWSLVMPLPFRRFHGHDFRVYGQAIEIGFKFQLLSI